MKMINGLFQSPLTGKKVFEWKEKLENGEKAETNNVAGDNKNQEDSDQDEFNPSLAAMEEEIKPQVISTIKFLCKDYTKLIKFQKEKLNAALNAQEFSRAKERNYQKIQNNVIKKIKTLQLNVTVLEDFLTIHQQENKKITSLEGVLMRLAIENKISRDEFLKYYIGNEINPNFESFLNENDKWTFSKSTNRKKSF